MKDQIELVDVSLSDLAPWNRNPRRIGRAERAALRESLERFGYVEPIVVNRLGGRLRILGGHQRAALLREAGLRRARCVVVELPESEAAALAVTLNNPNAQGQFTPDLAELVEEIRAQIGEPASLSLRLEELRAQLAESAPGVVGGRGDPEATPDPPKRPVTRRGDLWVLGEHRLVCGDATVRADAGRALAGRRADLVFTDPPYNMGYESAALGGLLNDRLREAEFIRLMLAAGRELLAALRPGGSYYVCMSAAESATVIHQLRKIGMRARQIVWAKPCPGLGAQDYRPEHEVILYGYREPRARRTWLGGRKEGDVWELRADVPVAVRREGRGMALEFGAGPETVTVLLSRRCGGRVIAFGGEVSDVWRMGRERGGYVHPTQKPVALVERALANSSRAGDLVYDPFAGSGTTLISCERLGRVFAGLELDPKYADVTVRRWEQFAGRKARREAA